MKCLICNQRFYIKRDFLNLFNTDILYVCDRCYKKYPIELAYEDILLEKYECHVISIFKKRYFIDFNAYVIEYNKIFESLRKINNFPIIFLNHLHLNDYDLEELDAITKLHESDINILCFSKDE
jgi:hypothetical protein